MLRSPMAVIWVGRGFVMERATILNPKRHIIGNVRSPGWKGDR